MSKSRNSKKTKQIGIRYRWLAVVLVFIIIGGVALRYEAPDDTLSSNSQSQSANQNIKSSQTNNSEVPQYSIIDADSIWVVVNKGRVLPNEYVPASLINPNIALSGPSATDNMKLSKVAADALSNLSIQASANGVGLRLTSGYRSSATQKALYEHYVATQGQDQADLTSARAGHSEHQIGLAVDIEPMTGKCSLSVCFSNTPEGIWISQHAHEFGFIIRYPADKVTQTGYAFEPWHLRYVGKDLAADIFIKNITMEEYFGLTYFPEYSSNPTQLR